MGGGSPSCILYVHVTVHENGHFCCNRIHVLEILHDNFKYVDVLCKKYYQQNLHLEHELHVQPEDGQAVE